MMPYEIPLWKTSPFLRPIVLLISGIVAGYYLSIPVILVLTAMAAAMACYLFFYFLPLSTRFNYQSVHGFFLMAILALFGILLTWHQDIRNDEKWFGHYLKDSGVFLLQIQEPLSEKQNSLKARCAVKMRNSKEGVRILRGDLFVYFSKDSAARKLHYGDHIITTQLPVPVKNSGNPGTFDYAAYSARQQVFHTMFLTKNAWVYHGLQKRNEFRAWIFTMQQLIITALQQNVPGGVRVTGIAEALLIGYKENLEQDLVQSYSSAGVVHIIAISGLHLGLIYWMLNALCSRLPLIRKNKMLQVILILGCLWIFSLLTGASASVLRSAVMFTCILIGKNFFRQSSIYNSLAASAFMLLCYDPYLLWDVGFQLSYLAIIGIVALQKPITDIFSFQNKILHKTWQMLAVTLAAQLSTFPVCLFYFHQFPNLFLVTNFIAVPLSTLILFIEIALVILAFIAPVAMFIGKLVSMLILLMNWLMTFFSTLSFAITTNIYASVLTTISLYLFLIFISDWLLKERRRSFWLGAASIVLFFSMHCLADLTAWNQKRIVIYNIARHRAMDLILNTQHVLIADSLLRKNPQLQNFHIQPGRIALQATAEVTQLPGLTNAQNSFSFAGKRVIVIDSSVHLMPLAERVKTDVLLLTGNPKVLLKDLICAIKPQTIVFDASNSLWKIEKWEREPLPVDLPRFSIPRQGAFILKF